MTDDDALKVFAALGARTRLMAYKAIAATGGRGAIPSDVAAALDIPRNLVSAHLLVLQRAGLVSVQRSGRNRTYRIRPETAARLVQYLSVVADD